ncbi:MAG: hypothetical protein ACK55Z_31190, partial [bacterium]
KKKRSFNQKKRILINKEPEFQPKFMEHITKKETLSLKLSLSLKKQNKSFHRDYSKHLCSQL